MRHWIVNFSKIYAGAAMLLCASSVFAAQSPNPRSAVLNDAAVSPRSDSKIVIRGHGDTTVSSAVRSRSAVAGRGADVSARAVAPARVVSNSARSATNKKVINSGRSAVVSARAASVPAIARSATKTGGATSARAGKINVQKSGLARVGRATAVFSDVSKIGGGYAECRESYATCMDQFCANANDTYRRCFCSSKFSEFRDTEAALDQAKVLLQRFEDNNLNAVDKTAAEVNAMYTATVGEAAIKNDVSGAQSILNEIGDLLAGRKKVNQESNQEPEIMDFTVDMDDIWGSTNSMFDDASRGEDPLKSLEGIELYSTSNKQCLELVTDKCQNSAVLNMATSSYNIMINQDCNLYEKKIDSQREAVMQTVRQAEKYLREARLDEYRAHNSADVNECLSKVKTEITRDTICGEDYRRCLDYSGVYVNQTTGELIYSTKLFKMVDLIKLDGSADILGQNAEFNKFLDSKRQFVSGALDTCRDIADIVWGEFKRTALIEIAQAQDEKIEEVKSSCVTTMAECYDEQTGQLKNFDKTTAQASGALAANAARTMCQDKVVACAALYGNGKCKFDKSTGKFTNAKDPECGVGALMDFVDTVDTVKIAEGCATALTNYTTQELCAPLSSESEREYPWGCRNMGIGELQSAISARAAVYCPDDMDKTGNELTDTAKVVDNLTNTITGEMRIIFNDECVKVGGIWVDKDSGYKETVTESKTLGDSNYAEQFYTTVSGKVHDDQAVVDSIGTYGECYTNSIKLQCEMQDEATGGKGWATYNEAQERCVFTSEWYDYQCRLIGGYHDANVNICYYSKDNLNRDVNPNPENNN